jgi:hypothetical protein
LFGDQSATAHRVEDAGREMGGVLLTGAGVGAEAEVEVGGVVGA